MISLDWWKLTKKYDIGAAPSHLTGGRGKFQHTCLPGIAQPRSYRLVQHRLFRRVVAFSGNQQYSLLPLQLGRTYKPWQCLQRLLTGQPMEVQLIIDGNDASLYLTETVAGKRLQLTFVRHGIDEFRIKFQPADFLKKSTFFNNMEFFFRFSGGFLQRMRTRLNRFFCGLIEWAHIRHSPKEQISSVFNNLWRFWS